jgi:hypothetical protein
MVCLFQLHHLIAIDVDDIVIREAYGANSPKAMAKVLIVALFTTEEIKKERPKKTKAKSQKPSCDQTIIQRIQGMPLLVAFLLGSISCHQLIMER